MHLYINFYTDNNYFRNQELCVCLVANLFNKEISKTHIFIAKKDIKPFKELTKQIPSEKYELLIKETRPSYNDFFKETEKNPNSINIIANTDIILCENSLQKLKKFNWENKVLALSRWDLLDKSLDISSARFHNHADSQDTWIKKGSFPQIEEADFCLGTAGCDNKIAFLLGKQFKVINPSIDIKTYHLHLSNIRNYISTTGQIENRIPPPYKMVKPIWLPN